jgi:hypothetical protein
MNHDSGQAAGLGPTWSVATDRANVDVIRVNQRDYFPHHKITAINVFFNRWMMKDFASGWNWRGMTHGKRM